MKNIFKFAFVFVLVGLGLVSCNDDKDATYLNEVRVSSSYVAIDVNGGTTSITITAKDAWSINACPQWLTISPMNGEAGETVVSFSAPSTLDGRTAELALTCGGKTQIINVIQGLSVVSDATCAEVIAGPDSKTYRVKGTCTAIANTQYGNWYLTDETGSVYIYGTLDAKGATKNFTSLGIEVGDVVTVEGPKTTYGTTIELVDVTVIKIEKSLIKCDSLTVDGVKTEDATFPIEGGLMTANLTCKGDGVNVEIPADAQDWLSIASLTGGSNPTVTFRAAENAGGDRSTTITFKTTQSGKEYTSEVALSQKGAIVAATCAEFLAAPVGDTQYRIQAVIQKVANTSYGNVYLRDYTNQEVYVYGIGSKGDFQSLGLKVGDVVTLVGKRGEFSGAAQMTGAQVEDIISVKECTVSEFIALPDSKTDYYMVTGDITSIANATYGNLYLSDGTSEVYAYGCYPGWGASGEARKNWLETAGIAVGDKLTMIGYKDTFGGTIELCGGIYFSHTSANQ